LLGQGDTVDRFRERMSDAFAAPVHLRKASGLWPPLHTSIMWQRNIPNRGAVMMHAMAGGFQAPKPPVLSLVTGKISYNEFNSRELMIRWLDHPQRLWDAVYDLLASGIEVVIHVGPDPNLIPATFKRLSDNVTAQVNSGTLNRLGMQAMRRIANRPWLSKVISARVALLRAPFVTHIILEDWLLAQGTSIQTK
jgi:[acyl-carrier-protein] S-malonyltransferase